MVPVSLRSSNPSPSSSKSSTKAGSDVESPVIESGIPSPSVSVSADGSNGNASGPAVQILGTAFGPSHIPSPSVSGFVESVPPIVSSESIIPSLSSSKSSIRPGESGLLES